MTLIDPQDLNVMLSGPRAFWQYRPKVTDFCSGFSGDRGLDFTSVSRPHSHRCIAPTHLRTRGPTGGGAIGSDAVAGSQGGGKDVALGIRSAPSARENTVLDQPADVGMILSKAGDVGTRTR